MHLFRQHAPADPDAALARIPIIDLGAVRAGEPGAGERVARELREARERVGFF